MRVLERFSMVCFSIVVLILSIITILLATEIVEFDILEGWFSNINGNPVVTVCISILVALWSIVNIFFKSDSSSDNSNGVMLENENGSLLITRDSLSNLVESVMKKSTDINDSSVKIDFDASRDVVINVVATVKDSTIIKNAISKLQEDIKLTIKKATDLDVASVNIKIKNVEQEKEKKSNG